MNIRRALLKRRISVAVSSDGHTVFTIKGKVTKKNQDDIKALVCEIANELRES